MKDMQHLCGRVVRVDFFESHAEIILDVIDPETGQQVDRCPECGDVLTAQNVFPMDFFVEVYAEMAESVIGL